MDIPSTERAFVKAKRIKKGLAVFGLAAYDLALAIAWDGDDGNACAR